MAPGGEGSTAQTSRSGLRGYQVAVGLLMALLVSCGEIAVVFRGWNMCDVGINANTNAFSLILFNLPVLVVVQAVGLIGGYALLRRLTVIRTRRAVLTVVVTIVIILAVAWLYFVLAGLPLKNALCPAGEPPWWPNWLPPGTGGQP